MNISLTPKLESMVNQKIKSGMYTSVSEVIREALRLLEEHDRIKEIHIIEMKERVMAGLAQIREGKVKPFSVDNIMALAEELKEQSTKA